MLDPSKTPPPGSGEGLIPLILPRQGVESGLDLNQKQSFKPKDSASIFLKVIVKTLDLSFYDSEISSDYRFFLLYSKINDNLPVYSEVILSPYSLLYLSPGTSFFPIPTRNSLNTKFTLHRNPTCDETARKRSHEDDDVNRRNQVSELKLMLSNINSFYILYACTTITIFPPTPNGKPRNKKFVPYRNHSSDVMIRRRDRDGGRQVTTGMKLSLIHI